MDVFSSLAAELMDMIFSHLPLDQFFVIQLVNARFWNHSQILLRKYLQQELQDAVMISFIHNSKNPTLEPTYTTRGWRRIVHRTPKPYLIVPQMECYHAFEIPARLSRTSEIQCISNNSAFSQDDSSAKRMFVGKMINILLAKKVRLFAPRPKRETPDLRFMMGILPPPMLERIFVYTPQDALLWAIHLIKNNHVQPFDEDVNQQQYLGVLKSERTVPTSLDAELNWTTKGYFNWRSLSSEFSSIAPRLKGQGCEL